MGTILNDFTTKKTIEEIKKISKAAKPGIKNEARLSIEIDKDISFGIGDKDGISTTAIKDVTLNEGSKFILDNKAKKDVDVSNSILAKNDKVGELIIKGVKKYSFNFIEKIGAKDNRLGQIELFGSNISTTFTNEVYAKSITLQKNKLTFKNKVDLFKEEMGEVSDRGNIKFLDKDGGDIIISNDFRGDIETNTSGKGRVAFMNANTSYTGNMGTGEAKLALVGFDKHEHKFNGEIHAEKIKLTNSTFIPEGEVTLNGTKTTINGGSFTFANNNNINLGNATFKGDITFNINSTTGAKLVLTGSNYAFYGNCTMNFTFTGDSMDYQDLEFIENPNSTSILDNQNIKTPKGWSFKNGTLTYDKKDELEEEEVEEVKNERVGEHDEEEVFEIIEIIEEVEEIEEFNLEPQKIEKVEKKIEEEEFEIIEIEEEIIDDECKTIEGVSTYDEGVIEKVEKKIEEEEFEIIEEVVEEVEEYSDNFSEGEGEGDEKKEILKHDTVYVSKGKEISEDEKITESSEKPKYESEEAKSTKSNKPEHKEDISEKYSDNTQSNSFVSAINDSNYSFQEKSNYVYEEIIDLFEEEQAKPVLTPNKPEQQTAEVSAPKILADISDFISKPSTDATTKKKRDKAVIEITKKVMVDATDVIKTIQALESKGMKLEAIATTASNDVVVSGKSKEDQAVLFVASMQTVAKEKRQEVLTQITTGALERVEVGDAIGAAIRSEMSGRLDQVNVMGIGLASGDDDATIPVGIWTSGLYGQSTQGLTKNSTSYNGTVSGVTVGVDANITDSILIGCAYTNASSDFKYKGAKSKDTTKAASNVLSFYSQIELNKNWALNTMFSYAMSDIKTKVKKNTAFASGAFKNTSYGFEGHLVYNLPISDNVSLLPSFGVIPITLFN